MSDPAIEQDDVPLNPRQAAVAMLKRAASTRESPSKSTTSPSPSTSSSPTQTRYSRTRPRAYTSHSRPPYDDDDTSLFLNPPGASSLERTASLLARQLAMSKLTGTAPPTPPPTFFATNEPLPTLEDLQRRARAKLELGNQNREFGAGLRRNNTTAAAVNRGQQGMATNAVKPPILKRNNTVTGIGVTGGLVAGTTTEILESIQLAQSQLYLQPQPTAQDQSMNQTQGESEQGTERSEARVNLMRKLSARRLASPAPSSQPPVRDRLAVVGRIGRARPRSGSVSGLDWRLGANLSAKETLSAGPPPQLGAPVQSHPREDSRAGIGIGISMGDSETDRSESPSTQRSSTGDWKDPNEPSTDEDEAQSDEERNAWEFDQALHPPTFPTTSRSRPESEMEHIRESKQHYPPPIQTTMPIQSSPHPSFRSVSSAHSSDRTPKAPWTPSFFPPQPTSQSTAPSSATTVQQARFSNPPPQHLVEESVSPNSSPQYPKPDWPNYEGRQQEHERRPSLLALNSSDVHLYPPTNLSSATVSPSASISSTSSSQPSINLPPSPPPNERTQRQIPTFGIAAVEAQPSGFFGLGGMGADRKRGSSASSSLAMLEASRRARERGSDATQLQLGSISASAYGRSRMGSAVSSIDSTGSGSGSSSGRMLEKVDSRDEDEEERLRDDRVDTNEGVKDTQEAAFPPPQSGYQFPGPTKAEGGADSARDDSPQDAHT